MMQNTDNNLDVARLARFLAERGFDLDLKQPPRLLTGGLANLNYAIAVNGRPAVLRRAPAGILPAGAHDMAREHFVLSRLCGKFPEAPESYLLCDDASVIGAPFQIIEFRDGRQVRGEDLFCLSEEEDLPAALPDLLGGLLAKLHAVDPRDCGLQDFGKPEGFAKRNAARWSDRAVDLTRGTRRAERAGDVASMLRDRFADWDGGSPVILHCDFKLDNLLLARGSVRPVALVDWDMATRGDALFDLGTLLSYWSEPDDPPCMLRLKQMPTALPGFPGRSRMAAAYAAASGRSVDDVEAFRALCLLKLAVVFLQLHQRWRSGDLGDDRYAGFEALGLELLDYTHSVAAQLDGNQQRQVPS